MESVTNREFFGWLWAVLIANNVAFDNLNLKEGLEVVTVLMQTGRGIPIQDFYRDKFETWHTLQNSKAYQEGNELLEKNAVPGMVAGKKCMMSGSSADQLLQMNQYVRNLR